LNEQAGQNDAVWIPPATAPSLGRDEVHVWRAGLDLPGAAFDALFDVLDVEERRRAARFAFEIHRRRFVAARGVLRKILGLYLSRRPAEIFFETNEYGKPALTKTVAGDGSRLHFNVSHSEGLALYAFSADVEVGVDVEHVRQDFATEQIAERFFSPGEVRAFRALPTQLRAEAFFHCWARKEAYIKALGKGLSHPLERFTVSLKPGRPALLLSDETNPSEVSLWSLRELPVDQGYAAALAVRKRVWRLRLYDWQPFATQRNLP
jgi:4'-phosphopantetheinyl transferase